MLSIIYHLLRIQPKDYIIHSGDHKSILKQLKNPHAYASLSSIDQSGDIHTIQFEQAQNNIDNHLCQNLNLNSKI